MQIDYRRRQLLGASLGVAAAAGLGAPDTLSAAVAAPAVARGTASAPPPHPGADGNLRRWRQYTRGRFGQVHVFSAAPPASDGARVPLVCLHPSPTTGEMYADLQAALATDRVVHCPDTPGYGASDAPLAKPGIPDYGGALAEAVAALQGAVPQGTVQQVDVFGFHTGSLCAVELALQRPDLVRRLVLSGVPHYGDAARRERERRSHVMGYPYFEDRDYVARMFQRLVLDAKDSGEPAVRLRRFGERLRAGPNGWWGPDAVFSYDSAAALPRLRVPTLLIAFNEEMTEPTREAAKLIPGARLVEMLDLPIFGFIVAPDRVAATIRGFLDAPDT